MRWAARIDAFMKGALIVGPIALDAALLLLEEKARREHQRLVRKRRISVAREISTEADHVAHDMLKKVRSHYRPALADGYSWVDEARYAITSRQEARGELALRLADVQRRCDEQLVLLA